MYKPRERKPQSLPTVSPRYSLNEETGNVEECGVIDDFALIQSSKDTAFKKVLERLGYFDNADLSLYDPKNVEIVDDLPVSGDFGDLPVESYGEFLERVQDYAEKKGLPATYSVSQILEDMRISAEMLKEKIKEKEAKINEIQKGSEKTAE